MHADMIAPTGKAVLIHDSTSSFALVARQGASLSLRHAVCAVADEAAIKA
jgi:hypothetical protein